MANTEKQAEANESNQEKGAVAEKKEYQKPTLTEYGAIERRTGGGTGTRTEGSMAMSSTRRS